MNKILFYLMTVCVAAFLLACVLLQVFLCEFVKTVGMRAKKRNALSNFCTITLLETIAMQACIFKPPMQTLLGLC